MYRILRAYCLIALLCQPAYAGMVTPYPGGSLDGASSSVEEYHDFSGGGATWGATEEEFHMVVPRAFTMDTLYIELTSAPGAGKSRQFEISVNGTDSALTCTVSNTATTCDDLVNSVSLSAGDLITAHQTPTSTPASTRIRWTVKFTHATTAEGFVHAMTFNGPSSSAVRYTGAHGRNALTTTETNTDSLLPTPGTFTDMYVKIRSAPGTGKSWVITARENAMDTSVTCTISGSSATTCNDTVNSFSSVATDNITYTMTPVSSPSVPADNVTIGMGWDPDTTGEHITSYYDNEDPQNAEYAMIYPDLGYYVTESIRFSLSNTTTTAKKMYIELDTAPGAGTSRTFTFRKNASDTALTCTISDTATTCNDTSNTVSLTSSDEIGYGHTESGATAATSYHRHGLVLLHADSGGLGDPLVGAVISLTTGG